MVSAPPGRRCGIQLTLFIQDSYKWDGAAHMGPPFILPGVCFHGDSKSPQVANQDHSLRVLESLQGCLLSQGCWGRGISVTEGGPTLPGAAGHLWESLASFFFMAVSAAVLVIFLSPISPVFIHRLIKTTGLELHGTKRIQSLDN